MGKSKKDLCDHCNITKATVFYKPNGNTLPKAARGYCVECYERLVRAPLAPKLSPSQFEDHTVRVF